MKILYISTDNGIYNGVIEYKEQMKKVFKDKIQFSYLKGIDVHPFDDEIPISINTRANLDFLFSYNLIVFSNTTNKNAVVKMKYLFDIFIKYKNVGKQVPQIAIGIHRGENTQEDKGIQLFKEEIKSLDIILITNSDINKRYYESVFNKSIINLDLIYKSQKSFLFEDKHKMKDDSCICCSRITHQKKIEDIVKLETPLKKTCIAVLKKSYFGGYIKENVNGISFETFQEYNNALIKKSDTSLFDELFQSIIYNNSILLENYNKTTYDKFISFFSKFL